MRYQRVRLHEQSDPRYRTYLASIMMGRNNHKASRPPSNRSVFGGEVEILLRQWLAQFYPLSNRRFVEYDERSGRQLVRKYREIDAVFEYSQRHVHLFEIKATSQVRSINRGLRQLSETATILQTIMGTIHSTLLLVDTGIITPAEVTAIMTEPDAPTYAPVTLDDFIRDHPQTPIITPAEFQPQSSTIHVVRFEIADIVALAGDTAAALHLDWSDELEEDDEPGDPPPSTTYHSHDDASDEDTESPLAAAMRRALDRPE
ncbi:MAG: hypothetical protein ACO3F2_02685 [Roseiflexaceae bacterium]